MPSSASASARKEASPRRHLVHQVGGPVQVCRSPGGGGDGAACGRPLQLLIHQQVGRTRRPVRDRAPSAPAHKVVGGQQVGPALAGGGHTVRVAVTRTHNNNDEAATRITHVQHAVAVSGGRDRGEWHTSTHKNTRNRASNPTPPHPTPPHPTPLPVAQLLARIHCPQATKGLGHDPTLQPIPHHAVGVAAVI